MTQRAQKMRQMRRWKSKHCRRKAPKLYLNTYEVTVEAGKDLDKTSYIKEMTDDADSQESLFNQIEIDGDVDTAVPGDYTLTYHVTDSDGNRSNAAVLTVHVQ